MSSGFDNKSIETFNDDFVITVRDLFAEYDKIEASDNDSKKKIKAKLKKTVNELNNWWIESFSESSDGILLFGDIKYSSQRRSVRKLFKEDIVIDMDLLHAVITLLMQDLENCKEKLWQEQQDNKSSNRKYGKEISELNAMVDDYENFSELVKSELDFSILSNKIKKQLIGDNGQYNYYWDDPRTFLPFSIQSSSKKVIHGDYYSGKLRFATGVEAQILPFGDAIIGWDNKHFSTADSCRINYSRQHVSIAISDGATQGGKNSGLYASILTTLVSSYLPVTQNGIQYYNMGGPMTNLYHQLLFNEDSLNGGIHSIVRRLGKSKAEEIMSKKYHALANIAQIIIQRSGAYQTIRFGDCCIFKLTADNDLIDVNVDPDLHSNATFLVGPSVNLNFGKDGLHEGKIQYELGTLSTGDILFGCTDKVAEFVVDSDRKEVAKLIRDISDNSSDIETTNRLFSKIAIEIKGEDDLSYFLYKHVNSKITQNQLLCTKNSESIVLDNLEYHNSGSDKYFLDSEKQNGLKRINKMVFDNLNHFKMSAKKLDFFVEYETVSSQFDNEDVYFVKMPHLNFQNLGAMIEEIITVKDSSSPQEIVQIENQRKDELENLCKLLEKMCDGMESEGLSHLDLSLTNILFDKENEKLICIDPNAFYCEGSFLMREVGHFGMYGDGKAHVSCLLTHRLPIRLIIFSLKLLISGANDGFEGWGSFNDTDSRIIFSPEEINLLVFPIKARKDQRLVLRSRILEDFNLDSEEVDYWLEKLDYKSIYSFE